MGAPLSIQYPLIDGRRHSWASIEFKVKFPFGTQIVLGFTEISYKNKLDPAIVRGAGSLPIGFTQGNAEFDGDFTILLEEYNRIIQGLGNGWMARPIGDIYVAYDESASGLSVVTDVIKGVRVTDVDRSAQATSADGAVRKCSFKYLRLLENGIDPMPPQPKLTV